MPLDPVGRICRLLAATACGILLAGGCDREPAAPARARNLLLVTIDTLRADRARPELMPQIDALAARGVTFGDATAHAPLTVPSHASILTGMLPPQHGVRDNAGFTLGGDAVTLAGSLAAGGFDTAAFVGAWVLARHTGLDAGFAHYDDAFDRRAARLTITSLERSAVEVTGRAAAWIAETERPFFAWVHLYDPHAPYDAPRAFADRFPGRAYDAEVAASDWAVGSLLRALPPATLDRTLVVVTSDHGESLGEHGEREHGIFVYDATLAVPLVIAGPGVPAGRRVQGQVRHVDVAPTVMELLGRPWAPGDGVSLVPAMHGAPAETRPSYAESAFGLLHFGWSELRALRDGEWKYIHAPDPELYDLRRDAGETDNVYAARASLAAGMAQHLARQARQASSGDAAGQAAAAEALRSLGYVSGGGATRAPGGDPKAHIGDYHRYVDAFNAGLEALETGRAAEAESAFGRLAAAFPDSFEARQYLGRARAARGRHRQAIDAFSAALALRPSDAGLYRDAAVSEAALRRFDRAHRLLDAAATLEPVSLSRYLVEGTIWRMQGDAARARAALGEALRVVPGQAAALFQLAQLDEQEGDPAAAAARYRAALASDPALTAAADALRRIETGTNR